MTGDPVLAPAPTDMTKDSYESFVRDHKGRLKGRFVLLSPPQPVRPETAVPFTRLSDEDLDKMARVVPTTPGTAPPASASALEDEFRIWGTRLNQFFLDEGVAAVVLQSRGEAGTLVSFAPGWARTPSALRPPTFFVAAEAYNRIVRLLERRIPVTMTVVIKATAHRDPAAAFSVTAELRGRAKPDDVVMVGAHLDSWTAGTGATDDAAGCAIAIEALRILAAIEARPARTVRIALWGGHEGAGLGSSTYVQQHFVSGPTSTSTETLGLYLNVDNGGGRIRGIYLPKRDAGLRPLFQSWLAPLKELGATTVAVVGEPSGSDHVNFYQAGLPGFMLMQDPLDYRTRTRHSNLDTFDHLQPDDLKQASAVVAALILQAANNDTLRP